MKAFILFALCFFGLFLLYPLYFILQECFFNNGTFTFSGFTALASTDGLIRDLSNSFLLTIFTTGLSLIIGAWTAFALHRYAIKGKPVIQAMLLLPLIIPPFIGAVGIQKILSRFGPLNIFLLDQGIIKEPIDFIVGAPLFGMILLQSLHFFPLVFFAVSSALNTFDYQLIQAARIAGASTFTATRKILLPLLSPALFGSGSLIAIGSFTDVGTPLVFEFRENLAVRIFDMLNESTGNPVAYALVLSTALLCLVLFLISRGVEKKIRIKSKTKGATPFPIKELTPVSKIIFYLGFLILGCFALLPHISMILLSLSSYWSFSILPESYSFQGYALLTTHELATRSIFISIFLSLAACLITAVLGLALGIIIEKNKSKLSSLFDFLVMLPIAIPGIVLAFGYFGGFAESIFDPRKNPFPLLAIGYSIRRLPYVVRNIISGLSFQSQSLSEAALICGASKFFTFRKVTLKLLTPFLAAGLILCFSYCMIEVSESLVLALSEKTYPIAKAMYALIARPDGVTLAAALGVFTMFITFSCSILSNWITRNPKRSV